MQITSSTALVTGRAQDIAGQESSAVAGGENLLAVATGVGATEFGLPANLWLFDTGGDQLNRIGAVSVTSSTVNVGQILRVALAGDFAYTSTFPLGINVVDLQQAITEYNQVFSTNRVQFEQQITTDGEGFANDAVVNTIPVQVRSDLWIGTSIFPSRLQTGSGALHFFNVARFTKWRSTPTARVASGWLLSLMSL